MSLLIASIKRTIKALSFWGVVLLLIFYICYDVNLYDLIQVIASRDNYIFIFCWFLLIAAILYPFLAIPDFILDLTRRSFGFFDTIYYNVTRNLCIPYEGIQIYKVFSLKDRGWEEHFVKEDTFIYTHQFIEMILWWAIMIFGIYSIFFHGDNIILHAIQKKTLIQNGIILAKVLATYIVISLLLELIHWLINRKDMAFRRMFEEEYLNSSTDKKKRRKK